MCQSVLIVLLLLVASQQPRAPRSFASQIRAKAYSVVNLSLFLRLISDEAELYCLDAHLLPRCMSSAAETPVNGVETMERRTKYFLVL